MDFESRTVRLELDTADFVNITKLVELNLQERVLVSKLRLPW